MNDPTKRYKFWIIFLAIFSALAMAQVIRLTLQNRQLRQALARPTIPPLNPGDSVEAFSAKNAAGEEIKVSYDDADYLIFITSAKCIWCERTLPSWKELAEQARAGGPRVVAISLDPSDELKSYAADNNLNFEVVTFPDRKVRSSYKVTGTPQTILVRRGGKVEKVWRGALSEESKREISDLLS